MLHLFLHAGGKTFFTRSYRSVIIIEYNITDNKIVSYVQENRLHMKGNTGPLINFVVLD